MKYKILIIEDDFCKFFSLKHLIENKFNLPVAIVGTKTHEEVVAETVTFRPNTLLFQPVGSMESLLTKLKDKKINRMNTEVKVIIHGELRANSFQSLNQSYSEKVGKNLRTLKLSAAA